MLVQILFAKQAVTADGQAMVRGENDDRVFKLAKLTKCLQNAADVMVDRGNAGIIVV